ncbi:MAG TPA: LysM peptidoglycan-binding domain-containing protein [Clostridiales bacterium]|jgi:hypothetical protein|nr:LysM peptidoglycan-binding domain-containing protein [Clostridiales bacterium]
MSLSPLRYKNFTWSVNPRSCALIMEKKMALTKIPYGAAMAENLGASVKVFRGEGEFAGEGAYAEFLNLAELFEEDTPGILIHPLFTLPSAHFVSLTLLQKPLPNFVAYTFEFWDSSALSATGQSPLLSRGENPVTLIQKAEPAPAYRTVRQGETLWSISALTGVSPEEIVSLNPQIKNPNLIPAGTRLRIR